jgi:formate dehydrogenase (coenzyme F420) beta subunit
MNFNKQRNEIAAICNALLEEGRIKVILGFTRGESDGNAIPFFIRKKEDVDKLVWDDTCTPNLAKYLLEKKDGAAILAKACDARAIVMYLAENQINRDNVHIIGVECEGMKGKNGLPAPGCRECTIKTPPVYDVLIKKEEAGEPYLAEAGALENREAELLGKLDRFQEEIKKCILCYSCRQACYGCYCETCFMDRSTPNWLPSELDTGSKMMFHLGRAMHLAGRCVECGACERVCPSGVNIRYLVKEITGFCEDLYGYQAGLNVDDVSALLSFKQGDREVGFLGGEEHDSCCDAEKPVT